MSPPHPLKKNLMSVKLHFVDYICIYAEVGASDRIPIAIELSNNYRNIELTFLSDFNYRPSNIGLLTVCYYCWSVSTISGILAISCLPSAVDGFLQTFRRIYAEHMSCWHPYYAVGVPADAIIVVS